jgi:diguanylate cyclase (GGDEF)-like protein
MYQLDTNRTETATSEIDQDIAGNPVPLNDALTGTFSSAFLDAWLEREILRARRYRRKTAIALVAVDRMARWNQLCGRPTGDQILARVADLVGVQIRLSDIVARISGDTFAVVLPETNIFFAHDVAEKVRQRVANADWTSELGTPESVTVSIGVTAIDPSRPMGESLARASRHLDRARTTGRNRVFAG